MSRWTVIQRVPECLTPNGIPLRHSTACIELSSIEQRGSIYTSNRGSWRQEISPDYTNRVLLCRRVGLRSAACRPNHCSVRRSYLRRCACLSRTLRNGTDDRTKRNEDRYIMDRQTDSKLSSSSSKSSPSIYTARGQHKNSNKIKYITHKQT